MTTMSDYLGVRSLPMTVPDQAAIDQLLELLRPIRAANATMTVSEAARLLDSAGRAEVLRIIDRMETRERVGARA